MSLDIRPPARSVVEERGADLSARSGPPPSTSIQVSVDGRTVLRLTMVVAVGIAVAQFARTLVQAVVLPLLEGATGHPRLDDAYFSIGSNDVYYGAALAATLDLLVVVAIALVLCKAVRSRRERPDGSASDHS